ncbi:MAG: DegT/DnrJ/EryC1/StrS family aminotransferase [Opitutales bacterium]|nr:DegT/DnrJ/EryC1/StrS family aminotransferase [Opitutales bacterium]MCH8541523.1 DegT/DnrJ/EryC1/StrS family aminotransferase [Opitutales bacterium]
MLFRDLKSEIAEIRDEIDGALARVLNSGNLILGTELEAFEDELGAYHDGLHVAGVASGMAGLRLLLQAYGIGSGDTVMVASNTYIATWLAVSAVGAKVLPVEPSITSRNLDASALPEVPPVGTRAILVTHLYGEPCDMVALRRYADRHGVLLLVDAAQSLGAEWKGSRSACMADGAALSFYPTKNLGALGDAGAVISQNSEIISTVKALRNYGMKKPGIHDLRGENARMEELHASVLRVKLRYLGERQDKLRRLAGLYIKQLAGVSTIQLPAPPRQVTHAWHLFTVLVNDRDLIQEKMFQVGIETAVHYPVPPHRTGAYASEFAWDSFPVASRISGSILSLPLYPSMRDEDVFHVVSVLTEALAL